MRANPSNVRLDCGTPDIGFLLRDKRGRVGRNPKTGVEVPIEARRVLVFKPSHVLKERVDSALSKD